MELYEIEARKAEIANMIDSASAEELAAFEEEVRSLNAEIEKHKAAAKAAAELRSAVADGAGETIKNFDEEKRNKEMTNVEYRNAWLKNLMGHELSVEERTAMTGTAAIPTETMNAIMVALEKNDLLKHIDLTNVNGYLTIPAESTCNAASWAATATDAQDALTPISLSAYQLIKTVEVPAQVARMSVDAFEKYMVDRLVNKIEAALCAAVVAGDGSSKATGILTTVSSATGTFTRAAATQKDLLTIMGALGTEYHDGAIWIMPAKVFYGECMNIANAVTYADIAGEIKPMLFGHPVVLSASAVVSNVDQILFGRGKSYHLNLAQPIEVSKDASVGFRSNSIVYRGVTLADGKLDSASAFVRYARANA